MLVVQKQWLANHRQWEEAEDHRSGKDLEVFATSHKHEDKTNPLRLGRLPGVPSLPRLSALLPPPSSSASTPSGFP